MKIAYFYKKVKEKIPKTLDDKNNPAKLAGYFYIIYRKTNYSLSSVIRAALPNKLRK